MVAQWPVVPSGAEIGVKKDLATKVSKRVSWLNDKAGLRAPIRINEVSQLLEKLGDVAAMKVLKDVELKSASLPDPTLFVKTQAAAQLKQGNVGAAPQFGAPHGAIALVPMPKRAPAQQMQLSRQTGPVQQPGGTSNDELYTDLYNHVSWLNSTGTLKKILELDKVYEALSALGIGAHEILTRLEQKAGSVNDPNGWVITAARKEQSGQNLSMQQQTNGLAGSSGVMGAPSDLASYDPNWGAGDNWGVMQGPDGESEGRLRARLDSLCSTVPLAVPLNIEKVIDVLKSISEPEAMRVLSVLEQKADTIRDPTGWILVSANKARQGAATSSGMADEKLRKRIAWLNQHGSLTKELSFERLSPMLIGLGSEAMDILKKLEESAATVHDPNGYVEAAVKRRKLNPADGATPSFSSVSWPGPVVPMNLPATSVAPTPVVNSAAAEPIKKKIGWLNHHANLQAPLRWDEVSPYLLQVDSERVKRILEGLEASAATVSNPNGYVINAAKKALQHLERVNNTVESSDNLAKSSETDQKIRRRIGWLNCNVPFTQPLMYNKVVSDLLPLGSPTALAILKEVEEHALDPDPNLWLIQRARDARAGAPIKPPEEKVSKRLAWLNENVFVSNPLSFTSLMPTLMELDVRKAMLVLKRLEENAATITDPISFVQSEASKEKDGQSAERQDFANYGESAESQHFTQATFANYGESAESQHFTQAAYDNYGQGAESQHYNQAAVAPEANANSAYSAYYDDSNLSAEDSLWYNVERLNGSRLLLAPLSYEQISPSLLAADRQQASRILQLLEKDGQYIEDPNAFVIAEAQSYLASYYS